MKRHWLEAQEAARKIWANFVFYGDACIAGSTSTGWIILTPKLLLHAQTVPGVELALQELCLPALGWE